VLSPDFTIYLTDSHSVTLAAFLQSVSYDKHHVTHVVRQFAKCLSGCAEETLYRSRARQSGVCLDECFVQLLDLVEDTRS